MNWKAIKEKCPKALQEAIRTGEWFIDNDGDVCSCGNGPRVLYDFFDENDIYIGIDVGRYVGEKHMNYEYSIWETEDCVEMSKCYLSRFEAEESAFTKAFEILEERL
jgi:hypothetical protein